MHRKAFARLFQMGFPESFFFAIKHSRGHLRVFSKEKIDYINNNNILYMIKCGPSSLLNSPKHYTKQNKGNIEITNNRKTN